MEGTGFHFTDESAIKMFQLKFDNEWLFKQKKQPWQEFQKILLQNGFPKEITVKQISSKWTYTYDMYRLAKKAKNKNWKYYKLFDKYCGHSKSLDKYESWDEEWRLKLITCISEAKRMKIDLKDLWRTVEMAMRCQDLPLDCCVQDMKGLWRHIRLMFNRKYRAKYDKDDTLSDWPLYVPMYEYYTTFEKGHLEKLETADGPDIDGAPRKSRKNMNDSNNMQEDNEDGFQWNKDITESFIQIRLQNDALFKDKKYAWRELCKIMVEEYSFPSSINGRYICKKWGAIYREYQKAKATSNKSWLYYDLFELYLGEGNLSLNPTLGWSEESLLTLINARTEMEHLFRQDIKDNGTEGWREVEKRLRLTGLPLDHSLLELSDIWTYLVKTFRWKQKFANKGILTEHWPFYDAMTRYNDVKASLLVKTKQETFNDDDDAFIDDDYEDDMKLFDLKQKIKPKLEYLEAHQCRSCASEGGCVNIFEQKDTDGLNLAEKLRIIGGVQIDKSDQMPSQICLTCLQELENAFKFRHKCQEVDKQNRVNIIHKVKLEIAQDDHIKDDDDHFNDIDIHTDIDLDGIEIVDTKQQVKTEKIKRTPQKRKKKKYKYEYRKICEICGKPTANLVAHLDMHSTDKMYSCEVCNKKFKFKSGLIVHKAVHEDKPRKTCEVCGKKFHVLAQYRRHFVYHANERKYECETCGKRFNTIDILRVHHKIHTDERPFNCPECGKSFRTAGCVARHKRIVHRVLPKPQ